MNDPANLTPQRVISISTATILKVVAVFLGIYFLYLIRDILLLVVISVILSAALTPLVNWLYERVRFPRALTVVLVYLVFIGLLVMTVSLLVPRLIEEFGALGSNIEGLRADLNTQGTALHQFFDRYGLSASLQAISAAISNLTSGVFQRTIGIFSGIFDLVTVLVMSFYLVLEQNGMNNFVKSLVPVNYHERIGNIVLGVQRRLGQWLIGQFALMFSVFIFAYLGLRLLGVKYALVLALFAGLLEIVPYLGPILGTIPATLVALLQSSTLAVFVLILFTIIHQVEGYVLVPRIIGRSIGANPLVVLLALLVGFNIAGIVGVLISAPIVAVGTVILEDYGNHRKDPVDPTQQSLPVV